MHDVINNIGNGRLTVRHACNNVRLIGTRAAKSPECFIGDRRIIGVCPITTSDEESLSGIVLSSACCAMHSAELPALDLRPRDLHISACV